MKQLMLIFLTVCSLSVIEKANCTEKPSIKTAQGIKKPEEKLLLITGCARSGTTYITAVLRKCGLALGHERLEKDGTIAWQGAFDVKYADWHWRFPDCEIKFKHIFHQIREPLAVITSVYNRTVLNAHNNKWVHAWEYICDCVPEINRDDTLIVKSAKYWYYWNIQAEKRAEWTYRLEDIEIELPKLGKRLGMKFNRKVLKEVPHDVNHRSHDAHFEATWAILEKELDPELLAKIKRLAERFDYPTHD